MSLGTKFVVFTTLIIVVTCSTLGWFFVQQQISLVTTGLLDSGTLLAQHLVCAPLLAQAKPEEFMTRVALLTQEEK